MKRSGLVEGGTSETKIQGVPSRGRPDSKHLPRTQEPQGGSFRGREAEGRQFLRLPVLVRDRRARLREAHGTKERQLMSADPKHIDKTDGTGYLDQAAKVVRNARSAAARSVNLAMVYAYFEVGRIVVEEEQASAARAEYGGQVLTPVSERLTAEFGRGFSRTNVAQMRQFYRVYAHDEIVQTVSEQFGSKLPYKTTDRKFFLSWSHYLRLMRIEDAGKRHFYEIEATRGSWSVRELQRQLDSSLYERLALSRDKDGVRRLAVGGQIVEAPADAIKDPYVLEFLGLKEGTSYSESDLETRIIDHLQEFLLELGADTPSWAGSSASPTRRTTSRWTSCSTTGSCAVSCSPT